MRKGFAIGRRYPLDGFRAASDPKISEPKSPAIKAQKTISATSEKTNYDVGMAYRFI